MFFLIVIARSDRIFGPPAQLALNLAFLDPTGNNPQIRVQGNAGVMQQEAGFCSAAEAPDLTEEPAFRVFRSELTGAHDSTT